jgi:hypothetical protein
MTKRAEFYERVGAGEMGNTVEAYQAFVDRHGDGHDVMLIEGDHDPNGDILVVTIPQRDE